VIILSDATFDKNASFANKDPELPTFAHLPATRIYTSFYEQQD